MSSDIFVIVVGFKKRLAAAVGTSPSAAHMSLLVEGCEQTVLLDSGSPISFISCDRLSQLQKVCGISIHTESEQKSCVAVNGEVFSSTFGVSLRVTADDSSKVCFFHVIDSPVGMILGLDSLHSLGCIMNFQSGNVQFVGAVPQDITRSEFLSKFDLPTDWSNSELDSLCNLLWKYKSIFPFTRMISEGRTWLNMLLIQGTQLPFVCDLIDNREWRIPRCNRKSGRCTKQVLSKVAARLGVSLF